MGFRDGAYATVWQTDLVNDRVTRCRISTSKKNKNTDKYEQDYSGFVSFLGTRAAGMAAKLQVRDRIRLKSVEVTTYYDKEKGKEYVNFNCYDFEIPDKNNASAQNNDSAPSSGDTSFLDVDNGDIDEEFLPY